MSAENIEAQVIDWVARMAEMKPERVTLTMRVLEDLGIDGDDAVEFFDGVHKQFGTDLTHLFERWGDHFGPEGMPLWVGWVMIPAGIVGGVVSSLLNAIVGDVIAGVVGVIVAAAIFVASIWIRQGFTKDLMPITVGEIVQAVQVGAWPRLTR